MTKITKHNHRLLGEFSTIEKFAVTIYSENEKGKVDQTVIECPSMDKVASLLITFQPKRGYTPMNWCVDRVEVLV